MLFWAFVPVLLLFICVAAQSKVEACETCSQLFSQDGYISVTNETVAGDDNDADASNPAADSPELSDKDQLIRELELELAQTKLALVESECKNQDLLHQLNATMVEAQSSSKNTWFQKTLSSIKEVTNKAKESSSVSLGMSSFSNPVSLTRDSASGRRDN